MFRTWTPTSRTGHTTLIGYRIIQSHTGLATKENTVRVRTDLSTVAAKMAHARVVQKSIMATRDALMSTIVLLVTARVQMLLVVVRRHHHLITAPLRLMKTHHVLTIAPQARVIFHADPVTNLRTVDPDIMPRLVKTLAMTNPLAVHLHTEITNTMALHPDLSRTSCLINYMMSSATITAIAMSTVAAFHYRLLDSGLVVLVTC